jgi:hypothetical protein
LDFATHINENKCKFSDYMTGESCKGYSEDV